MGSEFVERFDKPPMRRLELQKRVHMNLVYYRTNYLLIALALVALAFIRQPTFLIGLAFVSAAWFLALSTRKRAYRIGDKKITDQQLFTALGVVSFLVLWLTSAIFYLLTISLGTASIVLGHAVFRPVNLKARAEFAKNQVFA
eukprot:tig00020961_g16700.t1